MRVPDAGGWIGYLLMTRCLSPLLSDFGSAVVTILAMSVTLVMTIGLKNIADAFSALCDWATTGRALPPLYALMRRQRERTNLQQ